MKRGEERRAYWSALVARFEASGLSRRKFATEAGVGLPIFQYWLYKFRREGKSPGPGKSLTPAIRLVPVTVKRAPGPVCQLEVRLGAVRMRVPVGADPSYVGTLAAALRGRGVC